MTPATTTTSLPWHPLSSANTRSRFSAFATNSCSSSLPHVVHVLRIQALRWVCEEGGIGGGHQRRLASANDGFERLVYDAQKAAQRFDRQYSVFRRLDSFACSAAAHARELDQELEIQRRWRTFTLDFSWSCPLLQRWIWVSSSLVTGLSSGFGIANQYLPKGFLHTSLGEYEHHDETRRKDGSHNIETATKDRKAGEGDHQKTIGF